MATEYPEYDSLGLIDGFKTLTYPSKRINQT